MAKAEAAGARLELSDLLGERPLAEALESAQAVIRQPLAAQHESVGPDERVRPCTSREASMLISEQMGAGTGWHLLFSADIRGGLDHQRLHSALQALTDRHPALRTVFSPEQMTARVVRNHRVRLLTCDLDLPGDDAVGAVNAMVGQSSARLLDPFVRPPVAFQLTRVSPERHVLSMLIHHAVADGWSVGVLWKELFDRYAAGSDESVGEAAVVPAVVASYEDVIERRVPELKGVPTVLELGGDLERPEVFDYRGLRLPFRLRADEVEGCERLASSLGVTRNAVLLAAWSLTLARQASVDDLLLGLTWAGRISEAERGLVGLLTDVLPIRCAVDGDIATAEFVQRIAREMRSALSARKAPFEEIAKTLGADYDATRNTLVQFAFAAHDELVSEQMSLPDLDVTIHEGHCLGTVFDSVLYVRRWGDDAELCLEYATSVVAPGEAAHLVSGFREVLRGFVSRSEHGTRIGELSAGHEGASQWDPRRQSARAQVQEEAGLAGLWQMFESMAASRPDEPAFAESARGTLTYRQIAAAAVAQSEALRAAGVAEGDHVVLALPYSAQELVAVLAVLRLGAAYIGLDHAAGAAHIAHVQQIARPVLAIAPQPRAKELEHDGLSAPVLEPVDPWNPPVPAVVGAAAAPDPDRIAYVAFTSGSTGRPKAVRVPHRGVLRLVHDTDVVRPNALRRFLRVAPISFDASTLELFAPLAAGGCIVAFPEPYPVPTVLARFIEQERISGLWLTAGLFRLVAEHAPTAFRGVDQLLTGGDVVPSGQVRRVLEACPGLRVTNGYGPTENTTFTTVHHVDDTTAVPARLPIGAPVAGTTVIVVDRALRAVPEGAAGELLTGGAGLAVDYLGDAEETRRRFVELEDGQRYYRTGDVVRWGADGTLRFLGRVDRQVKIRGFRIELEAVEAALRAAPGVLDAGAYATAEQAGESRILVGVAGGDSHLDLDALRDFVAARLPAYAMPSLWAVTDALPVTRNGKVDVQALLAKATNRAEEPRAAARPQDSAESGMTAEEIEDVIAGIWEDVLGSTDFGYEDRFFDVGGDSLRVPQVRRALLSAFPGCAIQMVEMFNRPTIAQLAVLIEGRLAAS
ncbi:hypothetical protein DN069_13375 [Streptacidiphilus pinicola]|uniref:Carrier domain-containing protein n=2 Tax=Streptacidiphilus pinicola TaxID=2219663 RepID=A0A2X0IJ23_9ACTN|nr:hypothetical protein DN069_13375 [Streptacidiphilus pinicola]